MLSNTTAMTNWERCREETSNAGNLYSLAKKL